MNDIVVQGDTTTNLNPLAGIAFELYLDSPGNTNSVVYATGTRFEDANVRRGTLMTYLVGAGANYTERTAADGTLITRIKPVLKLRVRPNGLILDLRAEIKPQMDHNPGVPNWGTTVEVGPMLLSLNVKVTGRFVAPSYL